MYSFGRRLVAFRNDFCLSCGVARIAYRHRTFDVIHVLFIPLLPLGFWKRWYCGICGRNPHAIGRSSRPFKIILAALLGILAVSTFLAEAGPKDVGVMWFLRAFFGIPFLISFICLIRTNPHPRLPSFLR